MSTEEDLSYIKKFSKISITAICKKVCANKSNVYNGRASAETIHKVREAISTELELINGE